MPKDLLVTFIWGSIVSVSLWSQIISTTVFGYKDWHSHSFPFVTPCYRRHHSIWGVSGTDKGEFYARSLKLHPKRPTAMYFFHDLMILGEIIFYSKWKSYIFLNILQEKNFVQEPLLVWKLYMELSMQERGKWHGSFPDLLTHLIITTFLEMIPCLFPVSLSLPLSCKDYC